MTFVTQLQPYRVGHSLSMEQIKRDARRMKNNSTGLTLSQCQELLAARAGYTNLHALQVAAKAGGGRFTIKEKT